MPYYVIDRLEGRTAVVMADDGRTYDVPRRELPKGIREGTVLVIHEAGESPAWPRAAIDQAERARRLERARQTQQRLGETDPGGDVTL